MRLYLPSILIVGFAAMLALAPPLSGHTETAAMNGLIGSHGYASPCWIAVIGTARTGIGRLARASGSASVCRMRVAQSLCTLQHQDRRPSRFPLPVVASASMTTDWEECSHDYTA